MTLCPGKHQSDAASGGSWARDLDRDLDAIRQWGAQAVVTLMESHELERYAVAPIGASTTTRGMEWHQLPIPDGGIPNQSFETAWAVVGPKLQAHLNAGRRVLLHCLGGLGRTGTIAARLLIERGAPPEQAIQQVRLARPGTIENLIQEAYVRRLPLV